MDAGGGAVGDRRSVWGWVAMSMCENELRSARCKVSRIGDG
jgi:hypothetical protein